MSAGTGDTEGDAGLERLLGDAGDLGVASPAARETLLKALYLGMIRAELTGAAEETVLLAVKKGTGLTLGTLRADYLRIKGVTAKAEKKRRHDGQNGAGGSDDDLSQDSVAEAFAAGHKGWVVFCHSRGKWFYLDEVSGVWRADAMMKVPARIREVTRTVLKASDLADEHETKVRVGSAAFLSGVDKIARTDARMGRVATDFDSVPHLLGTPGGVYDLRTGKKAEGEGLISRQTAVAPGDKANCPRFLAFLDQSCGGDPYFVDHVVRAAGYGLWGANPERRMVFIHGPGRNGKSLLLDLTNWLFGEYAAAPTMACFMDAQNDRHTTDLAMLAGARLTTSTETKEGRQWDLQLIKAVTGGDAMTVRFMRKDNFTFHPQFLPMFAGNKKPGFASVGKAEQHRVLLWPFRAQVKVEDKELLGKLKAEGPAILRLLINECARWHADMTRGESNALRIPDVVSAATDEYLAAQEPVLAWIAERCVADPAARVKPGELYADYSAWMTGRADDRENEEIGIKGFKKALENLGYGRKTIAGQDYWAGLRLVL